eukprot:Anaeramoba_flamelloidesa630_267.p2 GENE.a630_267~~a630_267.p2  ORF type:complete len:183 (+),score=20.20 a630_267:882-1430(+)
MKSKKLVVSLLVMLAVVMSTLTFAYWASGVTGESEIASNTITVGSGDSVTTEVNFTGLSNISTAIVPTSIDENNDSITYVYTVVWDETSNDSVLTGSTATLSATAALAIPSSNPTNVTSNELDLFDVSVSIGNASLTFGDSTTVTITVIFDTEPADQAQYDLIASAVLDLNVTFTIGSVVVA